MREGRKLQQGYIYMDVIIGTIILSVALVAFAVAYRQSTSNTAAASHYTIATNLAIDTIEGLKKYEGTGKSRTSEEWKDTKSKVINNMQYQIVAGVIPDTKVTTTQIAANPRIIPVQVTVTWSAGKTVTMNTYFTQ